MKSTFLFVAWNILAELAFISAAKPASSRCTSISAPNKIPGIDVISIEGKYIRDYPLNANHSALEFCDVTIYLSHPQADDRVKLSIWLPPDEKWNGRFQATGGGGFATGLFELVTAKAVSEGFSVASTDGGHAVNGPDGSWALYPNRSINLPLFRNFASRSLGDMGLIGKIVTESFYGKPPHHSYWNGCSTGGRQGYMMAQKYPDLFDGVLANAPAIHFSKCVVAEMWPQIVMQQSRTFLSSCVAEKFVNASLDACDELDGVKDGVVMDALACDFDPSAIVGQEVSCEGESEVITEGMLEVVKRIAEGPKSPNGDHLWYGLLPSASYHVLASTSKYLILRDPDFDWTKMSYEDFAWVFAQSATRLGWLIDTDNPDLSRFRDAGGKLLTYHGIADEFIPVGGTIQYRQRVEDEMGGLEAVDNFYRLFLPAGVGHCGLPPAPGPVPVDPLASLIAWVEEGKAPDFLRASTIDYEGDLVERNICRYPYA